VKIRVTRVGWRTWSERPYMVGQASRRERVVQSSCPTKQRMHPFTYEGSERVNHQRGTYDDQQVGAGKVLLSHCGRWGVGRDVDGRPGVGSAAGQEKAAAGQS
jgi:hypothetical protein